jgi:hypothetical protein
MTASRLAFKKPSALELVALMESLAKLCHLKSDNPRFVPGTALMREYGADVRAGLLQKLKRDVAEFMIAEENDSHALPSSPQADTRVMGIPPAAEIKGESPSSRTRSPFRNSPPVQPQCLAVEETEGPFPLQQSKNRAGFLTAVRETVGHRIQECALSPPGRTPIPAQRVRK